MHPTVTHDPLDVEVGRVVRVLRDLRAGPAQGEIREAVVAFVHVVTAAAWSTSVADTPDSGDLGARFADFGGAALASVVAAVVFDSCGARNGRAGDGVEERVRDEVIALRRRLATARAGAS